MPKTYFLSNRMLNATLLNIAFVPPTQTYVALFTVAPTLVTPGTEVSGGSYTRQPVVFSSPALGQTSNNADVNFPIATVAWGTVVAFGLFDQASGGNLLYFANLSTSRVVSQNDQVRYPVGQLICLEN
jgi:hypothetical protein